MIKNAILPILHHPGRSALLVLTFGLGFASVLTMVATIEGGRRSIHDDATALGVDIIACLNPVSIGPLPVVGSFGEGERPIDAAAALELGDALGDDVHAVVPMRLELVLVRDDVRTATTTLMATTHEFGGVVRSGILAGRFLDAGDHYPDEPGRPVPAVLDEALARDFAPDDPARLVGTSLSLFRGGKRGVVTVLGVVRDPISLRKHLQAFDGQSQARQVSARRLEFKNVYVPWRPEVDAPSGVLVQLNDPDDVEAIVPRLDAFFSARGMKPFFHVQRTWVQFVIDIVDRFSSLSHFFWAIGLIVVVALTGTISLMSVEERFGEVALRRAEGATRLDVVLPLWGESTILALLSMPVGYGIAQGIIAFGVRPILDWPPYLPPLAIWGTPVVVLVVAWCAYLLPARWVARLEPAAVLREHRG